jgi:hypothetical protein
MKTSKLAKILALTSASLLAAATWRPHPELGCGTYLVRGVLNTNSQGDFILSVQKNTMSPYELIILGGRIETKLESLHTMVTLRVYVPRLISTPEAPFVFFQDFERPSLGTEVPYRLLKAERCGDESRFKGDVG